MKILGSILIVLASIVCSFVYEKRLKERVSCLEELCSFTNFAKSKIQYFSKPVGDIFNDYEGFENINRYINDNFSSLDKSELGIANEFFKKLGQGFKSEQIALCEYTGNMLTEKLNELKTNNPSKIKVFRAFSLFFGVSIIIFII